MDLGIHGRHRPAAFDTAAGKALVFERLQKELELTPAQSEQMQSVLNDFWQYYRTVLSESRSRVEQILTPEQRRKFERLLAEHQPK
jgi:Spy/CpxP family protein refolding chaperone